LDTVSRIQIGMASSFIILKRQIKGVVQPVANGIGTQSPPGVISTNKPLYPFLAC